MDHLLRPAVRLTPNTPAGARMRPGRRQWPASQNGAEPMSTVTNARPTQEDLLLLGLAAFRDCVDRYRDLTGPQRRAVLVATADLVQDLRAARVIP